MLKKGKGEKGREEMLMRKPYFVNLSGEELKKRREKRIENTLLNLSTDEARHNFNQLRTDTQQNNEIAFKHVVIATFDKFKENLIFVQVNSGLTKKEFTAIAGVSHNLFFTTDNAHIINLRLHTFLKIYALFLVYINIDFTDMFTLNFSQTFPFLVDQREENRRKLGKLPQGKRKKK